MSLDLKTIVYQQNNGSQVKLFDNSGDYDAVNNPTGWGAPNPERTDVTSILIEVQKGDITYSKTLSTPTEIANYLDPSIGITINSTDLLGAGYTVFEDGLYEFQISLTEPSGSHYDNKYEFFLWKMWCDIRKLTLTMSVPVINYLESYNIALLNTLFDDIIFSCQYGQTDNATEIYNFLRNTLDNETVLTELFKNFRNYAN